MTMRNKKRYKSIYKTKTTLGSFKTCCCLCNNNKRTLFFPILCYTLLISIMSALSIVSLTHPTLIHLFYYSHHKNITRINCQSSQICLKYDTDRVFYYKRKTISYTCVYVHVWVWKLLGFMCNSLMENKNLKLLLPNHIIKCGFSWNSFHLRNTVCGYKLNIFLYLWLKFSLSFVLFTGHLSRKSTKADTRPWFRLLLTVSIIITLSIARHDKSD